jgi:Domain of unknown function (DUF1772)
MSSQTTAIQTAQAFNLVQTAFAAGLSLSLSYNSIPTVLQSPSPVLAIRQWHSVFTRGLTLVRPLCGTAALSSFFLAYVMYPLAESPLVWKLYLIGGISSFAIFPWTIIILNPTNWKLVGKTEQVARLHYTDLPEKEAGISSDMIHKDIQKWGSLNLVRTVMLLITVVTSTIATFFLS